VPYASNRSLISAVAIGKKDIIEAARKVMATE